MNYEGQNNRHTVTAFQPWAGFAAPTRGVCLKINNFYDLRRFGRALTRAFLKDKGERMKTEIQAIGKPFGISNGKLQISK